MPGFKMKVTSGGGDFEQPSPGVKVGVCSRVIDRGTEEVPNSPYPARRRVQITWETNERTAKGGVMSVSKFYTLSLHEKAKLRQDLESWRGRPYSENEEIDLAAIIGQCAMLNLVKDEAKGYVNVAGVMPLPDGMAPISASEHMVFNFDDPDWDVYNMLHEKTQEKLSQTPEYKRSTGYKAQSSVTTVNPSGSRAYNPQPGRVPGEDDDLDADVFVDSTLPPQF